MSVFKKILELTTPCTHIIQTISKRFKRNVKYSLTRNSFPGCVPEVCFCTYHRTAERLRDIGKENWPTSRRYTVGCSPVRLWCWDFQDVIKRDKLNAEKFCYSPPLTVRNRKIKPDLLIDAYYEKNTEIPYFIFFFFYYLFHSLIPDENVLNVCCKLSYWNITDGLFFILGKSYDILRTLYSGNNIILK